MVKEGSGRQRPGERVLRGEDLFRTLVERAPDAAVVIDAAGVIVLVNEQAELLFGCTRDELLGKPVETLLPEWSRAAHLADRTAYLADPESRLMRVGPDVAGRRKDRTEFPADVTLASIETEQGPLAMALVRDVTQQRRAERERRRLHRALEMMTGCSQILVRAADEPALLAEVCETIVRVGGYRFAWVGYAEHDPGKTVRPVAQAGFEEGYLERVGITWGDEARGRGPTGTSIRTGQPVAAKHILTDPAFSPWREEAARRGYGSSIALPLRADGEAFGALNVYAEEADAFDEAEVGLLTGLADDVAFGIAAIRARAERERAEQELRESTELLRQTDDERRALLAHLVRAQEEERQLIATDIHDDTIQDITAVGLRLGALRRQVQDPRQLETLARLEETVSRSIERLRHLLFELHPPALDTTGGLSAVLREILLRLEEETGISVAFEDGMAEEPAKESRVICYRIAREALANVRRHAGASRVDVLVESREGGIFTRIRNDGVGFLPDDIPSQLPTHLGLVSMRERATVAGGWFRVDSAPDRGTTVEFWIPSAEPAES